MNRPLTAPDRERTAPKWRVVLFAVLPAAAFGLVPTLSAGSLAEKYFGLGPFGLYVFSSLLGLFVVLFLMAFLDRYMESTVTARRALSLLALLMVVITIVFVIAYPIQDARKEFGQGLDADDALDLAATDLMHGEYPYQQTTYFGNPISPLPGSIILALPFVALLGESAVQNLVWIAVLLWIMSRYYPIHSMPVIGALTLLSFPAFLQQLIAGSDYIANSIQMLLVVALVDRFYHKAAPVERAAIAVLGGLILSSRLVYAPLFPLLTLVILRRVGPRSAATFGALAGATFLAVTLPFYLVDPDGFSPLHTYDKLGQFEAFLPHYGILVPAIMILAAVAAGASSSVSRQGAEKLVITCAAVLTIPVLAGFLADSLSQGALSLAYWEFGTLTLVFWTVGAYPYVVPLMERGRLMKRSFVTTRLVESSVGA